MEIAFPILFLIVACALLGALAYPRVADGGGGTGDGDVCKLPPTNRTDGTTCLASTPGFTFNFTQDKCVSYDYGGCGSTGNFFSTEDQCNQRCPGKGEKAKRKAQGKGKKDAQTVLYTT
uniref:Putative dual kunitz salivary protein n=1 Tax=Ornithodoros turicata TaxID=34597 RepID=A0A2R5LNV8_9ACAR